MQRTRWLVVAVVVGLLLVPVGAAAQMGTVRGTVTAATGAPIAGAQVTIDGTGRAGVTDPRGLFLILNVPVGTHAIRVQSMGYQAGEQRVTVRAGETVTSSLRLAEDAIALERIAVTVGSRAKHTAAEELAVPVDVYTRAEIVKSSPQLEMATILAELSPAIFFPRPQIADITSGVRPFQLRGLSPDHSLVLVNGKRRHPTAVVHVFGAGSMGSGSSGVDMNAIVPSAIAGLEILRDGAAAQYGSDAIAGVINVQLRSDVHDPELAVTFGQYVPRNFEPDGRRLEATGSWGLALGDRGSLVIAGMYSDRNRTHRAGPDPRDQVVEGDADVIEDVDGDGVGEIVEKRNSVVQPNHLIGDGIANNGGAFFNAGYGLGEDRVHQLYTFGGYTFRRDIHSGFFRRGLDNRNWPNIHPLGFLPKFRGDTKDLMLVTGVSGPVGAWTYDLSGQFDQNVLDMDIFDTHNVSLGPCLDAPCAPGQDGVLGTSDDPGVVNKTDVYAGTLKLNQLITSLDVTRALDVGLVAPLSLALGASVRADNFAMIAGEPASWVNGWHPNRAGGIAPPGSQVFTGFRPDQEIDEWRTNVGLYADLETDLTRMLRIAAAARFESYSDFGETMTGKVAMRLQPAEQFILRGAFSTGFRAPGINQSYYSHVSTGFRDDETGTGNQVAYEIGEIPVNSPEARALGAEPLREETSINLSAGFAFSPTADLTFTVDGYRIEVDDRIILTGSLEDPIVEQLLAAYGAPTVKFFTNAVDTRTTGVDLTARYRRPLGANRYLELIGQYNRNELEVVGVHVPDVIAEIEDQVFTSDDEYVLENGRPRDRATLCTRYNHGRFHGGLAGNWYGLQVHRLEEGANGGPDVFLESGPHFVVDADFSVELRRGVEIVVGAENLFDRTPAVVPEGYNFQGIFPFMDSSGLAMNGRYLYTQVRLAF
jgi:iron complex outermembrane recepter protein